MITAILGKKLGMTQIFKEDGSIVPATVIRCGPCVVTQIKTQDKEGYNAIQLGLDDKRPKSATKPEMGHAKKANTSPKKVLREVGWDGEGDYKLGQEITVEVLDGVERVDVSGITKGRGFAGVVKRHGFHGGPKTHGQSDRHRAPGSIGQSSFPSRVFKGLPMAGHMGHEKCTVRNLEVVKVDNEKNLILVKGSIPGPNNGYVMVRKTTKLG